MTTDTYYYFKPDTFLRSDYGGAAIQAAGDGAEVTAADLFQRHVCRQLGFPRNHTQHLLRQGIATDTFRWFRVPATLYTALSAYLTAAELATVTTTAPTGWALQSTLIKFQPHPVKTAVFARGDSISAGLGTTTGDTRDVYLGQAMNLIEPMVFDTTEGSYTQAEGANYVLRNFSLGGSSWGNTYLYQGQTNVVQYPLVEDLAYNQRTRTIPLNNGKNIFIYWLGTNDLAYDDAVTGAIAWDRAAARIAALHAEFPNLKIIIGTLIKRQEGATLNGKLNDYNVLARANYLSAGAHILMDFEALVPEVNITAGDTTNTTYYTDGTHLTTAGHALLAPKAKNAILEATLLF